MIKKLFIKNYKNTEDIDIRNNYGKVAGIFGIISNLFLGLIKLIIGFISGSVSIMADAFNNLSDTLSSILTLVGFKLSSKKPDKEHPYGHARYEYVLSFVIALLMFEMGILLAKESIIKIIHPEVLTINLVTYITLIIAILVKTYQMYVYIDFSKSINSEALKTSAIDTRNDIIATTSILISMIIMSIFNINIDGYIGLLVSLLIIYTSTSSLKEVLQPLIGIIPTEEQVKKIEDKLLSYEYVLGIHDMVIHNYGVHNDFVTVHVEIDSDLDMLTAHDLMDNIERDFKENLGLSLTIHMDPVVINNPRVDTLKRKVKEALKKLDKDLTIHDFRIVEGKKYTNILFDCLVPYDKNYDVEELKQYLRNEIKNNKIKYYFVIEIDRPYC